MMNRAFIVQATFFIWRGTHIKLSSRDEGELHADGTGDCFYSFFFLLYFFSIILFLPAPPFLFFWLLNFLFLYLSATQNPSNGISQQPELLIGQRSCPVNELCCLVTPEAERDIHIINENRNKNSPAFAPFCFIHHPVRLHRVARPEYYYAFCLIYLFQDIFIKFPSMRNAAIPPDRITLLIKSFCKDLCSFPVRSCIAQEDLIRHIILLLHST